MPNMKYIKLPATWEKKVANLVPMVAEGIGVSESCARRHLRFLASGVMKAQNARKHWAPRASTSPLIDTINEMRREIEELKRRSIT